MAFYQNVFDCDFIGVMVLGDRQYSIDFKVPANKNTSVLMVPWATPPWNTVGNTSLTFNVSLNNGAAYATFVATLTASAALHPDTAAADLNANANFASFFTAAARSGNPYLDAGVSYPNGLLTVTANYRRENFRAYVTNGSAESVLRFNKKAGVAQLPSYFDRHTIANFVAGTFADSTGLLVKLTPVTDDQYITDAGLSATLLADWQLMTGRSGLFEFVKNTVDSSSRVLSTIRYPAGAKAGDLAKKTTYSYTGTQTQPDVAAEVPYVLQSADLITPP